MPGAVGGIGLVCRREELCIGVSLQLRTVAAGGLVRLLLPGLGAVCQSQVHPSAGDGAYG